MKLSNMSLRRSLAGLALLLPVMGASASANAASYPSQPVTMIVPFAAGGGTDSIARDVARVLSEKLGQTVIVENRGGGGGSIGASVVANARPDGHTLLFATSTFVTNAAAGMSTNYDVSKSFAPVAMLGRGPLFVVTAKDLNLKSIADLRALASAPNSDLNFCSAGNGSINHLSGELFKQKAQAAMTHVPYKGSGPATVDLLAGRVHVFFATVPTILSQVRDQRVDLLAVTSKERSPLFPDTPTLAEAGVDGFDITTWWGVLAPAGTPPEVVAQLNKAIHAATADELVSERLKHEGAQAMTGSPEDFGQALAAELEMWQGVVKNSGLVLN
jgi:tripartite-type tricarboxylate transporter receptor subunit TctC